MKRQEKILEKKKLGRPAIGKGVQLNAMVRPELVEAIDAYIAAQPDPKPSRPEAIRTLLREGLAAKGPFISADAETAIADRIELLEAKVASIPAQGEPSPETGMNTMKRALAEAELIGLRQKRKRVWKAKPKVA